MKCNFCNHINKDSALFCVECGSPFYKKCPHCNGSSLISYKFCPNCGSAFDAKVDALNRYKHKLVFFDVILNEINYDCSIKKYAIVRKDNLYGVFNTSTLTLIIPCEFESYKEEFWGCVFLKDSYGWYIYQISTGTKVFSNAFEDVHPISGAPFVGVKRNGLWGIVSCKNGSYLINPQYDTIDFTPFITRAKKGGFWGLIKYNENKSPEVIIPFEYLDLSISTNCDQPHPSQHRNKKWGVFSRNGNKILDFEYDEILYSEPFGHSLYYLRKGSLWGLYYSGGDYDKDTFYPCAYTKEQLSHLKR